MKLTTERDMLVKAFTRLSRIVERRTTVPILSNIALIAEGDSLRLRATDLDIEATDILNVEIDEPGSITVQAHLFADILKKLPARARITLAKEEHVVTIQSGRTHFKLQALPIEDFPDFDIGSFSHAFDVPRASFKRMIDKVEFSISTEETRYYLNGIYFHAAQGADSMCLRGVATDGHRLARLDTPLPEGAEDMPGVIIPRKTVAEIGKLIEDGEGDIHVELSSSKIRLTFGTVVLTSKLIDGTFPDYLRVIPTGNDKTLTVPREAFIAAVERVSTVEVDKGRALKMNLVENAATLTMAHPDSGIATEETEVRYEDDPIELGFNNRYLAGILGKIDADEAIIKMGDSGTPTIFHAYEGADALFVLMPMRV